MRAANLASLLLLFTASACAVGQVTDDGKGQGEPTAPRGVYVPIRAGERVSKTNFQPGGAPLAIYLNARGGTFRGGPDDASKRQSSVVASTGRNEVTFPPYDGRAAWDELVACVAGELSEFNVEVTDVEPTSGPYIEAVIGGSGSEMGMSGYAGVAPIDTSGCRLIDRAMVFVFARQLGDARSACEATVAEIGHAASLDHTFECTDPMSYLGGCGARRLQDWDMACGELSERPCVCGRARQNSAAVLREQIGARNPTGPDAPVCGTLGYAGTCSATGVLSWCDAGHLRTLDCAAHDLACGDTGDPALGNDCQPRATPDACMGITFQGECSAAGVVTYCLDGALETIDCGSFGESCAWVDDQIGYNCVVPPAPDNCMGVDFFGSCGADGVTLTYCLSGDLRVVNCAAGGNVCGLIDEVVGFGCIEPPPPPPPPGTPAPAGP